MRDSLSDLDDLLIIIIIMDIFILSCSMSYLL